MYQLITTGHETRVFFSGINITKLEAERSTGLILAPASVTDQCAGEPLHPLTWVRIPIIRPIAPPLFI